MTLVIAALVFVGFCLLTGIYMQEIHSILQRDSLRVLREVATQGAAYINEKVAHEFQSLAPVAVGLATIGENDAQAGQAHLADAQASMPQYRWITAVYANGTVYGNGEARGRVTGDAAFQRALQSETVLVKQPSADAGEDSVFVFYLPIVQNGHAIGVLAGGMDYAVFRSMVSVSTFDGQGFSRIANQNGELIVDSDNPNSTVWGHNLFSINFVDASDAVEMRRRFEAGDAGYAQYQGDGGVERFMYYLPLDINDWYMLNIVSEDVIYHNANSVLHLSTAMAVIDALLLSSFLFIVLLIHRNRERHIRRLAYEDPVTGIANWHQFQENARSLMEHRRSQPYAFLVIDVDKMHMFRDMLGNEMTKTRIVEMAKAIGGACGAEDACGRFADSHFVMLVAYRTEKLLIQRIEALVKLCEDIWRGFLFSISIGVYRVEDISMPIERMHDWANLAKEEISLSWDITYYIFDEKLQGRLDMEKEIEPVMQDALDAGEFVVYYQPKVSAISRQIVGAEALVRWNHPTLGFLSPGMFMDMFEKNGFVTNLDQYVFTKVCQMLQRWQSANIPSLPISINLSRLHLGNEKIVDALSATSAKYGISPSLLEIELTEEGFMEGMPQMRHFVNASHEAGFCIAVDDFGKGYSSLGMLYGVSIDILKLDRAFFREITTSSRARTIVKSVVDMANRLSMQLVSEGIETAEQVKELLSLGCDIIQGYCFAKPMPEQELLKMLDTTGGRFAYHG